MSGAINSLIIFPSIRGWIKGRLGMDFWKIATIVTAGLSTALSTVTPMLQGGGVDVPQWVVVAISALATIFASNTGARK